MKVLLVAKNNINKAKANLKSLLKMLDNKKMSYQVIEYDKVDEFYDEIHSKSYKNAFDILISFGGDGTILKSARIARKLDIPIVGINAGTVGFLTSINDFKDVGPLLDRIKKKDFMYEERSMLDVSVIRDGKSIFTSYAVNEVTIKALNVCKMGKYKLYVGEEKSLFTEYSADGIVIATPTGSTAHSLSLGGPIVSPDVNCFIITAIYPHTLNQRSIVLNGDKSIYVDVMKDLQIVDVDGRIDLELKKNDLVKVSRLKKMVKYIIFEKNNFLLNIKNKIKAI